MRDDLRSALRQVTTRPGLAIAIILTLALGAGSTTAAFSFANTFMFRQLPIPDAERVVRVRVAGGQREGTDGPIGVRSDAVMLAQLADFIQATEVEAFEAVATFSPLMSGRVNASPSTPVYRVSPGFFRVVRTQPYLGRLFDQLEYSQAGDGPLPALVTYAFWETALSSRPDIVGRTLVIRGARSQSLDVIGVLGREFILPQNVNVQPGFIVPYEPDESRAADPRMFAEIIAKIRPESSWEAAATRMQSVIASVERQLPAIPQGRRLVMTSLHDALFGSLETPLLMLLGVTACVMLLACANLAHLFTARLHARQREIGIRLALGATRRRLMRQLGTEFTLLGLVGGIASVAVALWAMAAVVAATPQFAPVYRLLPVNFDINVQVFALILVVSAGALWGLVPTFRAIKGDARHKLQPTTLMASVPGNGDSVLVFAQSAVAVTVLVAASFIVQSYVNLAYQPLGWNPFGLHMVELEFAPGFLRTERTGLIRSTQRDLYEELRRRLSAPVALAGGVPGVTLPMRADRPEFTGAYGRVISYPVSGSFFDVFQLTLKRGRLFDDDEAFRGSPVAVIDERTAAALWPGEDALGQVVRDSEGATRSVIGIVQSIRTTLLEREAGAGSVFIPITERTSRLIPYLRMPGASATTEEVRAIATPIVPALYVEVTPFRIFERTLGQPRFLAFVLGTLSVLTIALTVVGIYGVSSHYVSRRIREVAIRISLGAAPARVGQAILWRAAVAAGAGVGAGWVVSIWWSQSIRSLLFGLSENSVSTPGVAAAFIVLLVLVSALWPTWRAIHVHPSMVLRAE